MKKTLAGVLLAALCGVCYAQQTVVAIAPFEAKSGISVSDAALITEIFSKRLAAVWAGRVVTREDVDFEKVIGEHQFQMSDWSDENKTASLGQALNADWVVRGAIQTLNKRIIVTSTILDIKTLQIMGGTDMRLDSIDDIYDSMDDFVSQTVQTMIGDRVSSDAAPALASVKITFTGDTISTFGKSEQNIVKEILQDSIQEGIQEHHIPAGIGGNGKYVFDMRVRMKAYESGIIGCSITLKLLSGGRQIGKSLSYEHRDTDILLLFSKWAADYISTNKAFYDSIQEFL
jgi:TolB-like protein